MSKMDTQAFEIDQFLAAVEFRYGYDFNHYAKASLARRILNRVQLCQLDNVSQLIPLVLHDPNFFELFLKDMSITVTDMFRDAFVFKKIRESVFNQLRTYSRVNIWHAGCATGEEVYSIAIMLKEEGLLKRSRIYATDFNNHSLEIARKGIYPADKIQQFTQNYLAAGGKASFADYYHAKFNNAKMQESLKEHITFANHNLVKDQVFAQMHLILCRNVLIYFDLSLQNRVLNLFKDSLSHKGFLVLGDKESLAFTGVEDAFYEYEKKQSIYQRAGYV